MQQSPKAGGAGVRCPPGHATIDRMSAAPPNLHLHLLGTPRWRSGAGAEGLLSRTDAAILALVALPGEAPRERVAAWLWPEVPLKTANTNLRQRLFKLRQASGHALVASGAMLRLADGVAVDRLQPALAEGELLGGFDYGDLQALDAWVGAERERLRVARADALAARAGELERSGALAAAIELALRIVELVPAHEHGWRRLMRLHYLRGDRSAAVAAFERFEQQVCRELGLVPSAETLDLLHTIERGAAAQPARGAPLPPVLLRPPRLVGRDAALRAAQTAWAAGRAVLLLGEGGIGKSRLLADLLAGEPGGLGASLAGHARPGDAAMPYAVWTPLLDAALPRFAPVLDPTDRDALAHLLPALGPAAPGAARQAALWRAVESLLAACHAHGLAVLALDDLHLADPASLELTRWLVASPRLAGLRWLFGARPDEPGPAAPLLAQWLGDSSRIEPVRLAPLALAEVQALLDSLQLPLPATGAEGWAERLFRHAGGHPFYTLETLKAVLLFEPGGAQAALPLPQTAGAMIARRLAQLSDGALALLRWMALAPELLTLPLAARLAGRPLGDTAAAWAELEQLQLTRDARPAHDLVREQVLAAWPEAARVPQAHALAAALDPAAVEPARLAALWAQAHGFAAAAACYEQAAQAASRAGRLAEQFDLLQRAAEAWRRAPDAGRALAAELQGWHVALALRGSRSTLEGSEALLARAASDAERAPVHVLRTHALLNEARFGEALAEAEAAVRGAAPGSACAREAATLHGQALALDGRSAEALPVLAAAVGAAEAAGDEAQRFAALGAQAHALQVAGRLGEARDTQQRACEAALRLGDPAPLAQARCNLATLQGLCGQPREALQNARDADRRFGALGARDAHWVYNRITLARCAAHQGRLDEAVAVLEAIHEPAAAVGPALATMVAVIRFAIDDALGRPWRMALPDPDAAGAPISTAGVLLALHRNLRDGGGREAERRVVEQRLQRLAEAHPALQDDPVLAREWCRLAPAPEAVERLARLAARVRGAGAAGLARSLDLVRAERLAALDPPAATRLARELAATLAEGLHPATWPPQAWWALAGLLQADDPALAERCTHEARRWLDEAQLPPGAARDALKQRFLGRAALAA